MKCIIGFANEKGNYLIGLDRLAESAARFDNNPFIGFRSEASIGSPTHAENPYAFKIYAFRKALELGYRQILYLDSSVVFVNKINRLWSILEEDGYFIQEAGHYVGRWCNDRTLNYFNLSREEAMLMPMYGNCGLIALDFDKHIATTFLNHGKNQC